MPQPQAPMPAALTCRRPPSYTCTPLGASAGSSRAGVPAQLPDLSCSSSCRDARARRPSQISQQASLGAAPANTTASASKPVQVPHQPTYHVGRRDGRRDEFDVPCQLPDRANVSARERRRASLRTIARGMSARQKGLEIARPAPQARRAASSRPRACTARASSAARRRCRTSAGAARSRPAASARQAAGCKRAARRAAGC